MSSRTSRFESGRRHTAGKVAGEVDRARLESGAGGPPLEGSNPSPSASRPSAAHDQPGKRPRRMVAGRAGHMEPVTTRTRDARTVRSRRSAARRPSGTGTPTWVLGHLGRNVPRGRQCFASTVRRVRFPSSPLRSRFEPGPGLVAQLVARLVRNEEVAGSIPARSTSDDQVPPPRAGSLQRRSRATGTRRAGRVRTGCGAVGSASALGAEGRRFEPGHPDVRDVAQLGSAPDWGSGGRRFESGHPDQAHQSLDLALGRVAQR